MARNEPELSGTSAGWNSIPVTVNVLDVDEGPEFSAPTVTFNIKENIPNDTLIGRYAALDPETKSSNGITSATFIVLFTCKLQRLRRTLGGRAPLLIQAVLLSKNASLLLLSGITRSQNQQPGSTSTDRAGTSRSPTQSTGSQSSSPTGSTS